MKIKHLVFAVETVLALSVIGIDSANAETLKSFFDKSTINGQLKSEYWFHLLGGKAPNQTAFSLAGILNVHTAKFLDGFSVGATLLSAHSLGSNTVPNHIPVVMGTGSSLNALGQAYLQYSYGHQVKVRVGDQLLNTPWVGNYQPGILPETYQGVFAKVSPLKSVTFYGARIFRWKSATGANYETDNLYYEPSYDGAELYPGVGEAPGSVPLGSQTPGTQGFLAFGVSAHKDGFSATSWYYNFYQFTHLFYGTAGYAFKNSIATPFVNAQFAREWSSNSLLNGSKLNNVVGSGVNGTAWGVQVGLKHGSYNSVFGPDAIMWQYNAITPHSGSVGGGAILSPYTVGYGSDPLYTSTTLNSLVELGPGTAWGVKAVQNFFHKRLLLAAWFSRYHTYFNGNSNVTHVVLNYNFSGALKGFSVAYHLQDGNGSFYPGGNIITNHIFLTYQF